MYGYSQQGIWATRLEDPCIANGQVQLALLGSPFAAALAPQRQGFQILTAFRGLRMASPGGWTYCKQRCCWMGASMSPSRVNLMVKPSLFQAHSFARDTSYGLLACEQAGQHGHKGGTWCEQASVPFSHDIVFETLQGWLPICLSYEPAFEDSKRPSV